MQQPRIRTERLQNDGLISFSVSDWHFDLENQSKLALETGKSEKLQGDMESLTQKLEGKSINMLKSDHCVVLSDQQTVVLLLDMQVLLLTSQEKAERYSEDKTILVGSQWLCCIESIRL